MKFGHFDDTNREYVITRPDTPLPWINYLGTDSYFGLISNTAGGYSFYRDARLRRITRYRYNNVPFDAGGRYIYLRDDKSGVYWSPTWQPVRTDLDSYECRHGMGYSVIKSQYKGIETMLRYFVPPGETLEVWQMTLANHREEPVDLSAFSFVEFALWDAADDAENYQRNFNTGEVEVEGGAIYHKTEYRERRDHFAYFACSQPVVGFDTQREAFLGPYRGFGEPLAVEQGEASNSIAHGWAPVGSHHVKLTLAPGASQQVIFVLGYHENPPDEKFESSGSHYINKQTVMPIIDRYTQPKAVDQAFDALRRQWDNLLGQLQVETPDEHTNRMVNIWNAYQNMVTFNLSRSASFFESGVGRGMGFRDSNQDLLGFVHIIPKRARQRIIDLASTQMEDGGAYHQYQPLTKRGNDAVGSNFNDDPLWLVLAAAAYLKETADWLILDEPVPFDNREGSEKPLYEHLKRSIHYTLDRLGPHGLPLIGRADWNDCLNLNTFSEEPGESFQTADTMDGQTAESLFIAGQFVLAAGEFAEIAKYCGYDADETWASQAAHQISKAGDEHGWDGEWFLRAYDHNGDKVGSRECTEGQIFVESQGMCMMAGLGIEDGRATQALDAVRDRLATGHGIMLHQPAYTQYYINLGEISSYPPGYKENASIFCHTNPWIMISETMVGNGDAAHDYYLRICPSARETISETHRCEPYVYAQTIAGRDAPTHGEAKNSWLTGTAAWNYVAITQWILGIRPAYDGLEIVPVIPLDWGGFAAKRTFRGATYDIQVTRGGDGNSVSLVADGTAIEGTVVPVADVGETVKVKVTIS